MAAASSRAYQYTPLDSDFRILVLHPGPSDAEICCDIQQASFSYAPSYEALSYTWGDPKSFRSRVPCQGDPNSRHNITVGQETHSIRYNLMCALKNLRYEDRTRHLWVDALCINQDDQDERSGQVRHMSKIFSGSSRVLAWLGESDDYVDLAFDSLVEFCWATKAMLWSYCSQRLGLPISAVTESEFESIIERGINKTQAGIDPNDPFGRFEGNNILGRALIAAFKKVGPMHVDATDDLEEAALVTFGASRTFARYLVTSGRCCSEDVDVSRRLVALAEVFRYRAYWRRLWIVQEIVCSTELTLVCGPRIIDFSAFSIVRLALQGLNEKSGESILLQVLDFTNVRLFVVALHKAFVKGIERLNASESTPSLATAVGAHTWEICSDPRDNIYALLDISKPIDIPIDYNKSTKDLFILATREIIRQEKSLDILVARPSSEQAELSEYLPDPTIPSWVPSFDQRISGGSLVSFVRKLTYDAGGPLELEAVFYDTGVLEVRGYFLKEIIKIHHLCTRPGKETIGDIVASLANRLRLDPGKENYQFWDTLVMGAYKSNTGRWRRISANTELEREFRTHISSGLTSAMSNDKLVSRLKSVGLDEKKLCMLPDGIMALVNGEPEVGDHIFVARGASVPLVIRPKDYEPKRKMKWWGFRLKPQELKSDVKAPFKFVGGAYVHGIMSGEYVEEQSKHNPDGHRVRLI